MWVLLEVAVGVLMFAISEEKDNEYMDKMDKQLDENKKTGHKAQQDNTRNLDINNTLSTVKSYKPPG
jgi:hypothetical protein